MGRRLRDLAGELSAFEFTDVATARAGYPAYCAQVIHQELACRCPIARPAPRVTGPV